MSLDSVENEGDCSYICDTDLIRINICGMIYVTMKSTLERFPSTLLGNPVSREKYFIPFKNAYFFDRHRSSFEAILFFYQTNGALNPPDDISYTLFAEELAFFGLAEEVLSTLENKEECVHKISDLPTNDWQKKVWLLFEYPKSSPAARVIGICSVLVIFLSIIVSCMETMPMFHLKDHNQRMKSTNVMHLEPWFSLELGCISCFAVEFMLRLLSCPHKLQFMKSFLNIIDVIAILPYFIILSINSAVTLPLPALRIVRLARILQMFKLYRHSVRLQILGRTLKASRRELSMLLFFLMIGLILFSTAIYYAEQGKNDALRSIPDSFCYVLVTMTTVGYGEVVPHTLAGKLVGSVCAVVGVLAIAVPVPVIVSNFNYIYKNDHETSIKNLRNSINKRGTRSTSVELSR